MQNSSVITATDFKSIITVFMSTVSVLMIFTTSVHSLFLQSCILLKCQPGNHTNRIVQQTRCSTHSSACMPILQRIQRPCNHGNPSLEHNTWYTEKLVEMAHPGPLGQFQLYVWCRSHNHPENNTNTMSSCLYFLMRWATTYRQTDAYCCIIQFSIF